MTRICVEMSLSLDGFITGPDDGPGQGLGGNGGMRLHDWLLVGGEPFAPGAFLRPAGRNRELVDRMFAETGALLTGRRTYDIVDGWGGSHPMPGLPVVVLTHQAPATVPQGKSHFTFATDPAAAAAAARAAANGRDVMVHGAATTQALLAQNLIDELHLHLAPILLGAGRPLFATGAAPAGLECLEVIETKQATHLRYRVVKN